MKKMLATLVCLITIMTISIPACACSAEDEKLISGYFDAVNNGDIETYIQLYCDEMQEFLKNQLEMSGEKAFFRQEQIELLSLKKLPYEAGLHAAGVHQHELENFSDLSIYYAKEYVQVKPGFLKPETGTHDVAFIIGEENGKRVIIRIPYVDPATIQSAGVTLDEPPLEKQRGIAGPNYVISLPETIDVFLSRPQNYYAYGYSSPVIVSIDFSDYVKDIIPSEWTVSFGASYPEYLKACSLAVKTYSWHLTVYPVSSDPYYEVHDEYNQSYWVGTYDNLDYSNQYVLDQALYAISNYVMAKSAGGGEEKVFRAEYGSGIYGQYSGTLGDVTAKAQAQAGNLYQDILRFAYDYSYNGGWGAIVFRTHV